MRFEDTPELFGSGSGTSTQGDFHCDVCGRNYNVGADEKGNYTEYDSVMNTTFAGLEVCGECFEKIENAVLRRMPDILTWYRRLLDARKKQIVTAEMALEAVEPPNYSESKTQLCKACADKKSLGEAWIRLNPVLSGFCACCDTLCAVKEFNQ